ncbi:MAG TPA: winged helix-turn-helix domain-containing protein [Albitalea sp.]|uniref:ATP-binding protein n=1 Tax=Piscinibacter sp. TaxID=1903157 RepID=UPI002ECFF710
MNSYRFGRFELQVEERLLLGDDRRLRLGARASALLLALIERRGEAVSKEALLQRVWPHAPVDDNKLEVQVAGLRKLLGRHVIGTVPGRGYRLAVDVQMPQPAAAPGKGTGPAGLPSPAGALLGRSHELAELLRQLQSQRLVTVTGAAGIGKTMLAQAAARAHGATLRDGVVWVDLSPIAGPDLVVNLVAQTLHIEAAADTLFATVVAQLRRRELLLVLDNAEHVPQAVGALAGALAAAADVHVLITSQAPIKIDGELVFRLDPLSVPEPDATPEQAQAHGAVALFVDQATAVERHFALTPQNTARVIELCRRLDGLPLAIKLAAARMHLFGVDGLAARLSHRLDLLKRAAPDVPPRQRSLSAALSWSCNLLSAQAQTVLRRLGTFVGGFSAALAAGVAGDAQLDRWTIEDALEELLDHSLVVADRDEPARYRLLESVRAYALQLLDAAGEAHAVRRRHAQALQTLFAALDEAQWNPGVVKVPSLTPCAAEIGNLRAALDWCFEHDGALGVAILSVVGVYFEVVGLMSEGRMRCEQFAPFAVENTVSALTSAAFCTVRASLLVNNDNRAGVVLAQSAADSFRALGDTVRLQRALLYSLNMSCKAISREAGRRVLDEMMAIEDPTWPPRMRLETLTAASIVLHAEGRHEEALKTQEKSIALARQAGLDPGFGPANLAYSYLEAGHAERAISMAREALSAQARGFGDADTLALAILTLALLFSGRSEEAHGPVARFFEVCEDKQSWNVVRVFADVLALFAASEGRCHTAARLLGYSDHIRAELGNRAPALARAREQAIATVARSLDPTTIESCRAQGAKLGVEAVVALTRQTDDSPCPRKGSESVFG